jgi:hypothetical protein
MNITKDQAYARGYNATQLGYSAKGIKADIASMFPAWHREYPKAAGLDFTHEIVKNWQERMNARLDVAKYPETAGLQDIVQAEYQGYLDGHGQDKVRAAFWFNWSFYMTKILSTNYFGFTPDMMGKLDIYETRPAAECTAIWFEDTPDGPINGKNMDTRPGSQVFDYRIPGYVSNKTPIETVRMTGTASATVLYDEMPDEIFPVKLEDILPKDIKTVEAFVAFRNRYKQFCGPGNSVWVDSRGKSVVIEQSNCRMGCRYAENGVSCTTGLAYQDPAMKAFKLERDLASLKARGWTTHCPDWAYWATCIKRYDRLMAITRQHAKSGLGVKACAQILLDPHGPVPGRISATGEEFWPAMGQTIHTCYSWVSVPFGDTARIYWWKLPDQPTSPIWMQEPQQVLLEGVPMKESYKAELADLRKIGKKA